MIAMATGFLDSALLSFCSQYGMGGGGRMQAAMQIGVGFSSDISVYYRDISKIVIPGSAQNSVCLYFVIALLTLIVCFAVYVKLLRLPFSKAVFDAEQGRICYLLGCIFPRQPSKDMTSEGIPAKLKQEAEG